MVGYEKPTHHRQAKASEGYTEETLVILIDLEGLLQASSFDDYGQRNYIDSLGLYFASLRMPEEIGLRL